LSKPLATSWIIAGIMSVVSMRNIQYNP